MNRKQRTEIDENLCIGCGRCVEVCPSETLSMALGKARVTGELSLGCGHCAAVCPSGAVTVGWGEPEALAFETFASSDRVWSREDGPGTSALVQLMRSRRSCRSFLPDPVAPDLLEDLVRIGRTAPSGTNSQRWSFTVIPDRKGVVALGGGVADFFRRLNRMVEAPPVRMLNRVVRTNPLAVYERDYHDSVSRALEDWDRGGRDRLFHGAPAVITVGSLPGASTAMEDAMLATQNMLLAAHTMGLGTCLIGFAVEVMRRAPKVKALVGIPEKEKIYAVIAVGHPRHRYLRPTPRMSGGVRVFRG